MTDLENITPEDFVKHAASLRQFARSLLRCPSAADDAVQETWVRVAKRPRPAVTRLGSWLRTSLRNIVVSQARSDSARARREADATADGASDSPLDLLARRETLETVVRAVGRLSDEFQSVVFLRFFDGLQPREIAARLDIPVSVVHQRLRKALAELRTLLDDMSRDRDWRAGLAAAFGLPNAADPIWTRPIEGATQTMSLPTQLAVAAGAVVAIAVPTTLYFTGGDTVPDAGPAAAEAPEVRVAADDSASVESKPGRVPVDPDASTRSPLAEREPYAFSLEFHATTHRDLPAHGTRVVAGPDLHALNVVGTTDRSGRLSIQWRGSTPAMDFVVQDAGPSGQLRRIHVVAGEPKHVAVRAARPSMFDSFNSSLATATSERDDWLRFVSPTRHETTTEVVEVTEEEEFGVGSLARRPAPGKGRIVVQARDPHGQPVPDAHVVLLDSHGGAKRAWRTDTDGSLALDLIEGEHALRVGGGDHGLAHATLEVKAGNETPWTAQLNRGHELLGRLVDDAGKPLARWTIRVSSSSADDARVDTATTDADGNYAIPNVADRRHVVEAFAPRRRGASPFPMKTFESWPNRVAETVVEAPRDTSRITLRLVESKPDAGVAGSRIRVTSIARARAFERAVHSIDEVTIADLPAGAYRVEVGGAGTRWRVVEECRVAAGAKANVGAIPLEELGRLTLGDDRLAWLGRVRSDLVTRIVEGEVAASDDRDLTNELVLPGATVKGTVAGLDDVTVGVGMGPGTLPGSGAGGGPSTGAGSSAGFGAAAPRTDEAEYVELADVTLAESTESTTHFLLPPGDYVAVTANRDLVFWTMRAGERVELAEVLGR